MMAGSVTRARGEGRWSVVWRYGVAIGWWLLVAASFVSFAYLGDDLTQYEELPTPWAVALDLVVGAASIWAMRLRHRWPRALVVATILTGIVSVSAGVPGMWAMAHLATRRRWGEIVSLGALHVGVATLTSRFNLIWQADRPMVSWREVAIPALGSVIVVALVAALGSYVGARRDLLRALHERAEEAERRQELRVLQGRAEERNRIAREMHDVLAHRISLVSMHAGILAYREDLPAEQVREVAGVIQDNASQSMTELRAILGSLRQDEHDQPEGQPAAPQPGFDQVAGLFADARHVGQRLEVRQELEHADLLPTLVGRHIYRVVQELLTNARKHAPNAVVWVELTGGPGAGVRIRSRNAVKPGASQLPGSGVGLIGLRERAAVLGGTMTSGVDENGQFEVEVWFPW